MCTVDMVRRRTAFWPKNMKRLALTMQQLPHAEVRDAMVRWIDEDMMPHIRHACMEWLDGDLTLVTVPGAGHFVHHDKPEFISRTLKMWLLRDR